MRKSTALAVIVTLLVIGGVVYVTIERSYVPREKCQDVKRRHENSSEILEVKKRKIRQLQRRLETAENFIQSNREAIRRYENLKEDHENFRGNYALLSRRFDKLKAMYNKLIETENLAENYGKVRTKSDVLINPTSSELRRFLKQNQVDENRYHHRPSEKGQKRIENLGVSSVAVDSKEKAVEISRTTDNYDIIYWKEGNSTGYLCENQSALDRSAEIRAHFNYVCRNFARDLLEDANDRGFRCAYVSLDYGASGHAINAFETVDKGVVFVEPQREVIGENNYVKDSVGYWDVDNTENGEVWSRQGCIIKNLEVGETYPPFDENFGWGRCHPKIRKISLEWNRAVKPSHTHAYFEYDNVATEQGRGW